MATIKEFDVEIIIRPQNFIHLDIRQEALRHWKGWEGIRYTPRAGADRQAIEVLFLPEQDRAGVARGGDAQWTDASSEAEALHRFLNDEMVP